MPKGLTTAARDSVNGPRGNKPLATLCNYCPPLSWFSFFSFVLCPNVFTSGLVFVTYVAQFCYRFLSALLTHSIDAAFVFVNSSFSFDKRKISQEKNIRINTLLKRNSICQSGKSVSHALFRSVPEFFPRNFNSFNLLRLLYHKFHDTFLKMFLFLEL